jgi:hypothetical protein
VSRLNQEVDFRPAPKDSSFEKAGNASVIIEGREDKRGIDRRIADIDLQIEQLNAVLATLPTQKVQQADIKYRIVDSEEANIQPDIFVSEFSELVTFNRSFLEKTLREQKLERRRILDQFEVARKKLQYFTGEFIGLSIFDILCVFLALFTVDLNDLVSLLNQDARDRLRNSKFYNFQSSPNDQGIQKGSLFEANERTALIQQGLEQNASQGLEALQNKVSENFRLAEAFFTQAQKAGPNRG